MSHDQMDLSQVEHIWCPQPGPQLLATLCPADIIFFGGARGGGKTDTALGRQVVGADKYGHAWSGLFLRRHYKHFKELRRRIDELIRHGLPATRVGGDQQTNVVKFENGARIMLTAVEREEQLEFFQGQQFCVAEGTRILMGDGSPKNIEDVEAGDEVQTLEGPRRVRHKMAPRRDLCVRAETPYGSQVHPIKHPILSSSLPLGWISYAMISNLGSTDIEFAPSSGFRAALYPCDGRKGEMQNYEHPYSGEVRRATEETTRGPCFMHPYGMATVYDLTVSDVNHYISYDTGLINKNTEISIEEATQFAFVGKMIDKLKACLRSPHGVDPHMFLTGNPGGPGHNQVKQRFITPARQGGVPLKDGSETGMFIPSNVEDNRILVENDPKYVNRLRSIKDPNLRAAWLVGDWDVVMGGFFDDVWDENENVIPRFSVPEHWPRAMGLDWGTAKPFSVGWYAVSGGEFIPELGYALPRGAVVRYAEWYGCKEDEANTGLRLNSDQVAQGILAREWQRGEDNLIFDRIADPSIFKVDDGPSIGEKFTNEGVVMRKGDNRRIYGWDELRKLVANKELDDGSYQPMFYVTHNCDAFRRTVPVLERDEKEWDDLDTDGEDHVADEVRYVVMSRPASGISKSEHEMEQLRPKYGYFRRDWDEITADPEDSEDLDWGPANMDDPMTDVLDAIDVTTERRE